MNPIGNTSSIGGNGQPFAGPSNGIGETNQMFGTPSALSGGQAGKMGITQGPQTGMGTVAKGNLATNDTNIAQYLPGLSGGK